jgi:hypothetical protein
MASSSKQKTTMAKLMRESRLRERRAEKQARKDARKLAPAQPSDVPDDLQFVESAESRPATDGQPAAEPVNHSPDEGLPADRA